MRASQVYGVLVAVGVAGIGLIGPACSSSSGDDSRDPHQPVSTAPDNVTQTVGTAGGTVATPDGNAAVDIPEGALPADTTITIESNASASPPAGASTIGAPYKFGPDGLQFLKPVTVTLGFDPSRLGGQPAGKIVVYTAPDGSTVYEPLPTTPKDDAHVAARTMHFCTDAPGIPEPAPPPSDAGTCYVTCGSKVGVADAGTSGGSGGSDGGDPDGGVGQPPPPPAPTSCDCTATCDGHDYAMSCTDGSCTCSKDGVQTTTTPNASQCGAPTAQLATYNTGCGFPGELPPAPDCIIACSAQAGAGDGGTGADGGPSDGGQDPEAGVSSTVTCGCIETCKGHSYESTCTNGTCKCKTDGVVTSSISDPAQCGSTVTTFVTGCGFPGTIGGADAGAEGGVGADGGTGGGDGG